MPLETVCREVAIQLFGPELEHGNCSWPLNSGRCGWTHFLTDEGSTEALNEMLAQNPQFVVPPESDPETIVRAIHTVLTA